MSAVALPNVSVADLELPAAGLDPERAAAIYGEYGCLVVRGLMRTYVPAVKRDILAAMETAIGLLDRAQPIDEGWRTPDGTLFIPAPEGFDREQQVMVVGIGYQTSAAFFRSALDERLGDVVQAILGPDVELFMNGQVLVKEPVGGHPKLLHQDGAYFEHRYEGPVAVLSYAVDTDLENGALHVVPGSHKLGMLRHVDTESHLGLDPEEWPWERAVPIRGEAGDAIFFHVKTIHGSKPNWSPAPRPVFIHRYRAANDYVTVGATSVARRANAEKLKAEARKENQRGFMLRGFRPFEPNA